MLCIIYKEESKMKNKIRIYCVRCNRLTKHVLKDRGYVCDSCRYLVTLDELPEDLYKDI